MTPSGVMVDIETLSLRPNAVILSVAAVGFAFADNMESEPFIDEKSKWVLDIRPQLLLGRHVDPATQEWWSKQSAAARAHLVDADEMYLQDFATSFRQAVEKYDQVWAQGTDFDIPILTSLYTDLGLKAPWKKYNVVRDVRTIVSIFPKRRLSPDQVFKEFTGKEHDPMTDSEKQIWKLWEHWPA